MEKKVYIIGIGGSNIDRVIIGRVIGTENQVKEYLLQLVKEDKENDEDNYEHGTETIDDIEIMQLGEMNAYGCYYDCHIDYTACPETLTKRLEVIL